MNIKEVDFWVSDIGFPKKGLYVVQAYAGDGKTTFLSRLLRKYVNHISPHERVAFLYSEYNNIQTSEVYGVPEFDCAKIIWNYVPMTQTTFKDIPSLKEKINDLAHKCERKRKALKAVMFDDFDSWIATHSRFSHANTIHQVIQDACKEMREYCDTLEFPVFVTMMMQRDSATERLGTSLTYTRNI